jgi:hypothetical protein
LWSRLWICLWLEQREMWRKKGALLLFLGQGSFAFCVL